MLGYTRNLTGLFHFFVWQFYIVLVAETRSSNMFHRHGYRNSQLGRLCLDKYRRIDHHTACLPPSAQSIPIELKAEDRELIVDTHNRYRSGVTPPATNMLKMSWDEEIAMIAQAWAETCSLRHDEATHRDIPGRLSLGQNVGDGYPTWSAVIDAWFDESRKFTYGADTNAFEDTGHYTQGVWADSNKLGCGSSWCGNIIFYVCNYGPAGNVDPLYVPYKTGEACSECPLHCKDNLCDCGDFVCENGGRLIRESCQCDCRHRWLVGRECKLNCSAVKEPKYCGIKPFDREGCDLYENVPHDCPTTCERCPYGDGQYKEGSVPLQNPDNNNNSNNNTTTTTNSSNNNSNNNSYNNDNNNINNDKGDNTSTSSSIYRGCMHFVLIICFVWSALFDVISR